MSDIHTMPMRVAWVDTDAGGRIHWSAVFRWAEVAEHDLLRALGRPADQAGPYPRRATNAVYHHPLHFDDVFDLELHVEQMGRTSVTFGWRARHDGRICVEGSHTVIHVDETGRPHPWPAPLTNGLADYLSPQTPDST